MSIKMDVVARRWLKNAAFKKAYDALGDEFALAHALVEARTRAGLTQIDVAKRMQTSQSAVARLEAGRLNASLDTLRRYARATNSMLRINLEPRAAKSGGRKRKAA